MENPEAPHVEQKANPGRVRSLRDRWTNRVTFSRPWQMLPSRVSRAIALAPQVRQVHHPGDSVRGATSWTTRTEVGLVLQRSRRFPEQSLGSALASAALRPIQIPTCWANRLVFCRALDSEGASPMPGCKRAPDLAQRSASPLPTASTQASDHFGTLSGSTWAGTFEIVTKCSPTSSTAAQGSLQVSLY